MLYSGKTFSRLFLSRVLGENFPLSQARTPTQSLCSFSVNRKFFTLTYPMKVCRFPRDVFLFFFWCWKMCVRSQTKIAHHNMIIMKTFSYSTFPVQRKTFRELVRRKREERETYDSAFSGDDGGVIARVVVSPWKIATQLKKQFFFAKVMRLEFGVFGVRTKQRGEGTDILI